MPNYLHYLIFTDLDGILLDHDGYNFDAAKLSLAQLSEQQIPVIINSSKTASEIQSLRLVLNNQHPFIIENGSAVFVPENYFSNDTSFNAAFGAHSNSQQNVHYEENILGKIRAKVIGTINTIYGKNPMPLTQYSRSSLRVNTRNCSLITYLNRASSTRFSHNYRNQYP